MSTVSACPNADGVMPIQLGSELQLRIARGERIVHVKSIPWAMFTDAAERQCDTNHGQTLRRIAERQGFDASEAVAVLSSLPWQAVEPLRVATAHRILYAMQALFQRGQRVAEARAAQQPPVVAPLTFEEVTRAARAIYEADPVLDQETDLDGRPTSPAYAIPWSSIVECHLEVYDHSMALARAALVAARNQDAEPGKEPGPGELCPGCKEAVFQDRRAPKGTCGWCGYNPVTKQHGGFRPAGSREPRP